MTLLYVTGSLTQTKGYMRTAAVQMQSISLLIPVILTIKSLVKSHRFLLELPPPLHIFFPEQKQSLSLELGVGVG